VEVSIAVFLFVLVSSLALMLYASRRNYQRRRERAASHRLGGSEISSPTDAEDTSRAQTRTAETAPGFIRWFEDSIAEADLPISAIRLITLMLVLFVAATALMSVWFHVVIAAACGLGLASLPLVALNLKKQRRLRAFAQQLPYVLDMLKSALESGHSLLRGLQMAANNSPEPMAGELRAVVEQVRVGMTLSMALTGMYRRIPMDELGFVAAAVRVQAEIGSSLAEILQHVSQSVRNRQRLSQQIRALTAQSRASAIIVSILPIIILVIFSVLKPDYTRPLFTNPLGIRLLQTAIVLDVMAFFAMRRIAKVDY
jgi:tight adherence protein B